MSNDVKLTIRLYPGLDDDLIMWFNNLLRPYGRKGEAIKAVIRCGLAHGTDQSTVSTKISQVEFDTSTLLAGIRQVMDASLESALAGLSIKPHQADITVDADTEDLLSNLDAQLLIKLD